MSTTYNSDIIRVNGNIWVALGDADIIWLISSVGGVPIELVMLPVGIEPTEDTKRQYTIGGMINVIKSLEDHQCWFRCTSSTDVGLLLLRPYDLGEFNEISMVKASVVDLHTQMINLSSRVTTNQLQTDDSIRRIKVHEFAIQNVQASMASLIAEYASMNVRIATSAIKTKKYVSNRISVVETAQKDYESTLLSMQKILSTIIANHSDLNTRMRLNFNKLKSEVRGKLMEIDRRQIDQERSITTISNSFNSFMSTYTATILNISTNLNAHNTRMDLLHSQFVTLQSYHEYLMYIVQEVLGDVIGSVPIEQITPELVKRSELDPIISNLITHIDSIKMGSLLIHTHMLVSEVQSIVHQVYFNQLINANVYTADDLRNDLIYILMNMLSSVEMLPVDISTMKVHMSTYIANRELESLLSEYLDILEPICVELQLTSSNTNTTILRNKYTDLITVIVNNTIDALMGQTEPPIEELPSNP